MKWYQLTLLQIQPIHIGKKGYGVISDTEIFIPGSVIWGALTNACGIKNSWDNKNYEDNQKLFEKVTCFYPKINDVLFPKFMDGEFHIGDYSEKKFRYYFTDTILSTAIVPEYRSAKDESLHEIGMILPRSKKADEQKQLYWVGVIGVDDSNNSIKSFLKVNELEIRVGGEQRYGLGLLKLIDKKEIQNSELQDWNLDSDGNYFYSQQTPLRNYFLFDKKIEFEGKMELLAEFNFQQNAPDLTRSNYFISPGSIIVNPTEPAKLSKGKFTNLVKNG
jgi:hypothetical protein